ncbi:hypothetical protein ACJX0J_018461, partial [Zea mays]
MNFYCFFINEIVSRQENIPTYLFFSCHSINITLVFIIKMLLNSALLQLMALLFL